MNTTSTLSKIKQAVGGFFTILILYLIPQIVYLTEKYYMYDFELDSYIATVCQITCSALYLFALYSGVRYVTVYNSTLRDEYHALKHRPNKLSEKLMFFLQDTTTQIGAVVFGALHFILPLHFLIMPIVDIVPGAAQNRNTQIIVLIAYLVVLYVISLAAELTAMRHWQVTRREYAEAKQSEKKRAEAKKQADKEGVRISLIYLFGSLALCNVLPILISIFPLFKELLLNPFTGFVIACVILVPLIYRPIRALIKRREFLKKLDTVCRQQGIALSDIDLPYRSIFSTTETESFTVTVNGKRYACKLIGALKRGSPMGIFQGGEGAIATHVRFARITLFSRVTQFEFGFASEDQKILIINPVPKMLYRTENGKTTELDNGDVVDGYKVYTASGFIGALERGSIDR